MARTMTDEECGDLASDLEDHVRDELPDETEDALEVLDSVISGLQMRQRMYQADLA